MRAGLVMGVLGIWIAGCASGATGNGSSAKPKPEPTATASSSAASSTTPETAPAHDPAICVPTRETLRSLLGSDTIDAPKQPADLKLDLPAGIVEPPLAGPGSGACAEVGGLGALAAPGHKLRLCCERIPKWEPDRFMTGCLIASACTYSDETERRASTLSELARMVAPIDTPAKALGLVALVFAEVLDPARASGSPFAWKGLPDAPAAFEVLPEGDGFMVRAPAFLTCGCSHPLFRVAFSVSRSGCAQLVDLPVEPLAHCSQPICVD